MKDANDSGKGHFWLSVQLGKQYNEQTAVEYSVMSYVFHTLQSELSYMGRQRLLPRSMLTTEKYSVLCMKTQIGIRQLKKVKPQQRFCDVKWRVQTPFLVSDCLSY